MTKPIAKPKTAGQKIIKGLKQAVEYAKCDHDWEVRQTTGVPDSKTCKKCRATVYTTHTYWKPE